MRWKVTIKRQALVSEVTFPNEHMMNLFIQALLSVDWKRNLEIKTEVIDWATPA